MKNAQLPLVEIISDFTALFCQEEVSSALVFIVYTCMSHSIKMGQTVYGGSDLTSTIIIIKRVWSIDQPITVV